MVVLSASKAPVSHWSGASSKPFRPFLTKEATKGCRPPASPKIWGRRDESPGTCWFSGWNAESSHPSQMKLVSSFSPSRFWSANIWGRLDFLFQPGSANHCSVGHFGPSWARFLSLPESLTNKIGSSKKGTPAQSERSNSFRTRILA